MLFEQAIKAKKVRKDIVAYQYKNGIISFHRIGDYSGSICRYEGYSLTEAIRLFRKKY
jgi:hypothetical protein